MVRTPIYFDNNATTRTDPRVVEAMLPYFTEFFGNAASTTHAFGRKARQAVEQARAAFAKGIGAATPSEIVFTSGATESDNLAIKGAAYAYREKGDHLITCLTEHKAVLDTCKHLEHEGFAVTYLKPQPDGLIGLEELEQAMTDRTILVSIMHANNEIGVLQDIGAIGKLCQEKGVLFHSDAAQSLGKVPFDAQALHVDLASFTAHKIYGPKNAGALYVRKSDPAVNLALQMHGGGHEGGMRSGTLNVPGIVGLATALELCLQEIDWERDRLERMCRRLLEGLKAALPGICLNGHPTRRAPGNLSLCFPGLDAGSLMLGLNDVAVSAGSACNTGSAAPSYVLKAIGMSDEAARSTLRFGLGRFNTEAEVEQVIARFAEYARRAPVRLTKAG
ncbi:MAG TPA: cysteine desulfurase family protein [Chthonomonadaceae bacterium]|nr:cysteine desulfurase family protein [Chthonomonadaceae bacterium]